MKKIHSGSMLDQWVLDKADLTNATLPEHVNHAAVSKELAFLHRHFCAAGQDTPVCVVDKRIQGLVCAMTKLPLSRYKVAGDGGIELAAWLEGIVLDVV